MKTKGETVEFFAYGPDADLDVVTAMIGRKPLSARPAVLEGFRLGIQNIDDIPDVKVRGLQGTARQMIRKMWKDDVPDFEMYVVRKGKGQVKGIVYTMRKEDMEIVKDWELVASKWYSIVEGKVTFDDGKTGKVLTIAVKNQNIQREVDGLHYDLFFNRGETFKRTFLAHVKASREQYLERERKGAGIQRKISGKPQRGLRRGQE
jgi:hypothetical protein